MLALANDQEWPVDSRKRVDVAVDRMWETFHQDYFWASTELWLAARSNSRLRDALEPHERRLNAFIIQKVGTFFGDPIIHGARYAVVRDQLITSMRGVALSYAFRPRDPRSDPHVAQWKDIAQALLLGEPANPRRLPR